MNFWKDLVFMKTFDSEYKILVDWMKQKNEEYIKKCKISLDSKEKGYDGELCYERESERKLVVQEYNRRLDALKKKYGKDTVPQGATTTSRSEAERVHV